MQDCLAVVEFNPRKAGDCVGAVLMPTGRELDAGLMNARVARALSGHHELVGNDVRPKNTPKADR